MGSTSFWNWVIIICALVGLYWFIKSLLRPNPSAAPEVANTFKFRTVVYIILAFAVPLWLVTFPLFLYLAYKSYVAGIQPQLVEQLKPTAETMNVAAEIAALHKLVDSGALSDAEFQAQKARLLGTNRAK